MTGVGVPVLDSGGEGVEGGIIVMASCCEGQESEKNSKSQKKHSDSVSRWWVCQLGDIPKWRPSFPWRVAGALTALYSWRWQPTQSETHQPIKFVPITRRGMTYAQIFPESFGCHKRRHSLREWTAWRDTG